MADIVGLENPVPGTKSYNAQNDTLEQGWWIVDAEDQIVGRIASDIAMVLMGKHRPNYTPNVDTGEFVVVINCDKVKFSGNKLKQKRTHGTPVILGSAQKLPEIGLTASRNLSLIHISEPTRPY